MRQRIHRTTGTLAQRVGAGRATMLAIAAVLAAATPLSAHAQSAIKAAGKSLSPAQDTTQTYTNPILFSDYSDPDVIRDGNRYIMVASSFHYVPGLPILSSPDLVHWHILAHALPGRIDLAPDYDLTKGNRYGRGVWAPAIRVHAGRMYIFFPTPDEGIFMVSRSVKVGGGGWTKPVAVIAGPNLEDPCPFWDNDGNAYLIHSRTGAGPLILHRMSADATHVLDEGKEIVNDRAHLPTLEGPKLYKRNGWYYIFAPFGGVSTGKQVTLRSRNIYGPYEQQVSLQQGTSDVNGPHQGAWVTTPEGKDYFVHFQSRGAHGRIVHLEPMRWENDWPVMGTAALDPTAPRPGQPVPSAPMPVIDPHATDAFIRTSDEFNDIFSLHRYQQWEWNHNPVDTAWSVTERKGYLRLHALPAKTIFDAQNTLTQQMQSESLTFTARMDLSGQTLGSHAGLTMFEQKASGIVVTPGADVPHRLFYFHVQRAKDGTVTKLDTPAAGAAMDADSQSDVVLLRATVHGDTVQYSYSDDEGKTFHNLGPQTPIDFSWWKGARPALFHYVSGDFAQEKPYVDVDWVHVEPLTEQP